MRGSVVVATPPCLSAPRDSGRIQGRSIVPSCRNLWGMRPRKVSAVLLLPRTSLLPLAKSYTESCNRLVPAARSASAAGGLGETPFGSAGPALQACRAISIRAPMGISDATERKSAIAASSPASDRLLHCGHGSTSSMMSPTEQLPVSPSRTKPNVILRGSSRDWDFHRHVGGVLAQLVSPRRISWCSSRSRSARSFGHCCRWKAVLRFFERHKRHHRGALRAGAHGRRGVV